MAQYCIPIDKIPKILSDLKEVGMEKFFNLSSDKRIALFKKHIGDDAIKLNNNFERAFASKSLRAVGDLMKRNFDQKAREALVTSVTRAKINRYILDKLHPVSDVPLTKSIKEIEAMSAAEKEKFLSGVFSEKELPVIKKALDDAKKVETKQKEIVKAEKAVKEAQNYIKTKIEKFLENKKHTSSGKITIKEILGMPSAKREKFLADNGVDVSLNKKIDAEKKLRAEIKERKAKLSKENAEINRQAKVIQDAIDKRMGKISEKAKKTTVSFEDVEKMSDENRADFFKKYFGEDSKKIEEVFKTASDIAKKEEAALKAERLLKKEETNIENKLKNYIDPKKKEKGSSPVSTKDIVAMKHDERLAFLKGKNIKDAENLNDEITKTQFKKLQIEEQKLTNREELKMNNAQKAVVERHISDKKIPRFRTSLTIERIMELPQNERLDFIKKYFPEDAESVLKKIESKLKTPLEKQIDRELARYTNINDLKRGVGELNDGKINLETLKADLESIVGKIAASKDKTGLSIDEMTTVSKLSSEIDFAREKFVKTGNPEDGRAYGRKLIELQEFVGEIKSVKTKWEEGMLGVAGLQRALLAGYEFSATGIQYLYYLPQTILPFERGRIARKAFVNAMQFAFSREAQKDYLADIAVSNTAELIAKTKARNTMSGGKLTDKEEDFMTNLLSKVEKLRIPIISRIAGLGEGFGRFHSGLLTQIRMETADRLIRNAQKAGLEMSDENLEYLGTIVNDFTGSSRFGKLEDGNLIPALNTLFFSLRKILSDVKKVTVRPVKDTYVGIVKPMIKKDADRFETMIARESLKTQAGVLTLVGTVMGLANLAKEGGLDVDVVTEGKNAGTIRIGEKNFSFLGGLEWYPKLLSRLFANGSVNEYGVFEEYGTEYGQTTKLGDLAQTLRYKLSPNAAIVIDYLAGQNAIGKKFFMGADRNTIADAFTKGVEEGRPARELLMAGAQREAYNRLVPMYWQGVINEGIDTGADVVNIIVGLFGFTSRDESYETEWIDKTGKKVGQFVQEHGVEKTEQASKKYATTVKQRVKEEMAKDSFKALDDKKKMTRIRKVKDDVTKEIFKEYGFKYASDAEGK